MTGVEILRGEHMKKGDTLPDLRVKLLEAGDPFNLSGYTVTMKMRKTTASSLLVDTQATVEDASRGIVTYTWSSSETDEAGTYLLEFVADDGSDSMTFPNDSFAELYIEEGL